MDPRQFDSLILQNQGFNTLNNVMQSNAAQNMSQQTQQSIQTMQTPVSQGHVPQHAVLPMFQNQTSPQHPTPSHQFFAIVNGTQKGPFTFEQLKGLAIADVINVDSMVWLVGSPEWTDLKTCLSTIKL